MKKMILMMSLLALGATAVAEENALCSKTIPCGIYEGSGHWLDTNGKQQSTFSERIEITPVDAKTVNLKVYIYVGEPTHPWTNSNLVFGENGRFDLVDTEDGQTHATGYCHNLVCTVAFPPVGPDADMPYVNSFVDILTFGDGTLDRYNMVVNKGQRNQPMLQLSQLKKK